LAPLNEHGNFGATIEEVRAKLDQSTSALARIKLQCCETIERHRTERFYWMIENFQLKLRIGKRRYSLRQDFSPPLRAIEGDECWVWEDGSDTLTHDVYRKSAQWVERQATTQQYRGQPREFATEGGYMVLDPVPDSITADILVGRGIKIVPPPERRWNGTTWDFPTDDFTNEWFTEGASLVETHMRYKLLAGPMKNPEDAAVAAGEYEEIKRVMEVETDEDDGVSPIDPWPAHF